MRAFRAWLIAAIAASLLTSAGVAGATAARVDGSREKLRAARETAALLQTELDRAAAVFEKTRAHAERLGAEEQETARGVADAQAQLNQADAMLRRHLVALFKFPELRANTVPGAALTDDVGESLHRIELLEQLAHHGAQDVERTGRALGRVRNAEHDYRVVTAGVRDAVRQRRDQAAELTATLAQAQSEVDRASDELRAAEAAAEAERRRRRAEAQRVGAVNLMAAGADAPLPPVDGKFCPVGAPNAFSDSWGAPRSGGRSHQGVDMFAKYGTPLYAVDAGSVRVSNNALGGLSVHLTTADGNRYYYAHLSAVAVSTGQRVRGGQTVGAVGNSGNARYTPPHLHWQYHPGGGAPVNPTPLALALCR